MNAMTPTQAALIAAHKAREKRKADAARRHETEKKRGRVVMLVPPEPSPHPELLPPSVPAFATHARFFAVLSKEFVIDASGSMLARNPPVRTMAQIAEEVLKSYPGVTLAIIKGRSRKRSITFPRQHVVCAIRDERPEISWLRIAAFAGLTDHTTAMHAYKAHKARMMKKGNPDDGQ